MTSISGVGEGGLAVDSSGDIFFVNSGDTVSEFTSGGIQSTLGPPLLPDTFRQGFSIGGVDNQGNLWGLAGSSLYALLPNGQVENVGAGLGLAIAVNSSGQAFVSYTGGTPGAPNGILQVGYPSASFLNV